MKQKGFTLLEVQLIIILVLIAILLALVISLLPEAIAAAAVIGGIIGSGSCSFYIYVKEAKKKRPGSYFIYKKEKFDKQRYLHKLSKDLSQSIIKQIKRIWNFVINAFFREKPPKHGGNL